MIHLFIRFIRGTKLGWIFVGDYFKEIEQDYILI